MLIISVYITIKMQKLAINIMNVKVVLECPYKQSKIGSCIDDLGGEWESAKEPTINAPFLKEIISKS